MKLPEIDESSCILIIELDNKSTTTTRLHIPKTLSTEEFAIMLNGATHAFTTLIQEKQKLKESEFEQIVAEIVESYNRHVREDSHKPMRIIEENTDDER